jgi:ubiquinone/menaquinone biosynthesis C-methylase UbiE
MPGVIDFNAEAARRIEAAYLTTDVVAQRIAVHEALDIRAGERVLDIGSGPGLLAHELAKTVGPEGRVCGVDISDAMIEMGRQRCASQRQCEFKNAEACALPFEDEAFDAVVSTQVYEYVADIPSAMRELHRVVRRGGRVCIIDTDYDSLVIHTEHPERMRRVLEAWDAHFIHADLPRKLAPALTAAGFEVGRCSAIPIFNREYHPNAFSYHLLPLMSAFAKAQEGVTPEEAEAWLAEFEELGGRGEFFYSLNRYLFTARRPNS